MTKRPGDGKPAKTGLHGSDHHKTKTTTVEVKIKSVKPATIAKPSAKPSPRPSPGIGTYVEQSYVYFYSIVMYVYYSMKIYTCIA